MGEFYSVALTNDCLADTGTKMIHLGKNTRSTVLSKAFLLVMVRTPTAVWWSIMKNASGARNYTQCDSLLIGDKCGAHTFPYIEVKNASARMEHKASSIQNR